MGEIEQTDIAPLKKGFNCFLANVHAPQGAFANSAGFLCAIKTTEKMDREKVALVGDLLFIQEYYNKASLTCIHSFKSTQTFFSVISINSK